MTIIEKLRQRARHARLVAEACILHNVGATGYDIQLDEDAACELARLEDLADTQDQMINSLVQDVYRIQVKLDAK